MNPERTNKSQFTISDERVKSILSDKKTIETPITRLGKDDTYVREVDVGNIIGKLPEKHRGKPTSIITVLTDKEGNLVNVYPGPFVYKVK